MTEETKTPYFEFKMKWDLEDLHWITKEEQIDLAWRNIWAVHKLLDELDCCELMCTRYFGAVANGDKKVQASLDAYSAPYDDHLQSKERENLRAKIAKERAKD